MEILDLYDGRKNKLDKTFIRGNGEPKIGEYKQSIHIWIINDKNELLIEKRNHNMRSHPGKWSFIGGVPDTGESLLEGAIREAKEELGINLEKDKVEFLLSFRREHDFVDVWITRNNIDLKDMKLQETEVSDAKWVSLQSIKELINKNEFVPSINLYWDLFQKLLDKNYFNR